MAKYLKDSEGMVRAVTSTNLGLEKPLTADNYDIGVHNRNMDKLDVEINNVKNGKSDNDHTHSMSEITGLELSSTKVNRPNNKTVEESIAANETSILNLQNELGVNKTTLQNNINAIREVL